MDRLSLDRVNALGCVGHQPVDLLLLDADLPLLALDLRKQQGTGSSWYQTFCGAEDLDVRGLSADSGRHAAERPREEHERIPDVR